MKALTLFLRILGLLLVLALGAVIVLITVVDPNDYQPKITALVKQHTGRELILHGDWELTFFPWLGVKTGRVELSNAEGFGDAAMLAADEVSIKVKLLPLLKSRVQVGTLILNQPRIRLARKADGTTNWDDLAAKIRHGAGISAGKKSSPDDLMAGLAGLAGLTVQGISIQHGWVDWQDQLAGQTLTLRALNLNTGALLPGKPMEVDVSMIAEGSWLPARAAISLTSIALPAENLESVALVNTVLRVAMQGNTADHDKIHTILEIPSFILNRLDESWQLPQVTLKQDDFFLSGSAHGSGLLSGVSTFKASGELDARIEDVKGFVIRNHFLPVFPSGLTNSVIIGFQFNIAKRKLVLSDLTVASVEQSDEYPQGKILINEKEITIPIKADGTLEYGHVLAEWSRREITKKFNRWLSEQIIPSDDAKKYIEQSKTQTLNLKQMLKEKLNQKLQNILE